jgi:hypothetical protein
MSDWSNPNRFQLEALHEALLFAYPRPTDLNLLLQFGLGRDYFSLAPVGESYKNALLAILLGARGDGWLQDLVQKAREEKPHSPKLSSLDRSFKMTDAEVPTALGRTLEDIVRHDANYQDLIPWVQKLEGLAWKTCRIEYPVNTAQGTGWLISPDLVITNWHVIDRAFLGGDWTPSEFVCRFDYAVTSSGTQKGLEVRLSDKWCVDSSPPSPSELGTGTGNPTDATLDYALLKLEKSVDGGQTPAGEQRGWVKVNKAQPLPKPHDIIFVVQHPEGLPVKLAPGDVAGTSNDQLRIFHTANTQKGSSGSLVVDAKLEPIALHHAGDLLYNRGKLGQPENNQAVPIGKIVARLIEKGHLTTSP